MDESIVALRTVDDDRFVVILAVKHEVFDRLQSDCLGDEVQIESCRPLSRSKRWRLQKIVKRAEGS